MFSSLSRLGAHIHLLLIVWVPDIPLTFAIPFCFKLVLCPIRGLLIRNEHFGWYHWELHLPDS